MLNCQYRLGQFPIDIWAWKERNYIFIDKQFHSLYKSTSFPPGPLQDSAAVIRLPGRIMIQDPQTTLSYWTAPKLTGSGTNKSLLYKSSGTQGADQSQESRFLSTVRRHWLGKDFFLKKKKKCFFKSQTNHSAHLLNGFLSACVSSSEYLTMPIQCSDTTVVFFSWFWSSSRAPAVF